MAQAERTEKSKSSPKLKVGLPQFLTLGSVRGQFFESLNLVLTRLDLINDALPFGRQWYREPDAIPNSGSRSFTGSQYPNSRSARAMQDGVRLALLHFLQQLTDFRCGRRNDLDTAPFPLR